MFMTKLSEWLRKELRARDWTQADLANNSGIPPASISRIINETRGPSPETCRALAETFNYPQEYVFKKAGLIDEKEKENIDPTLAEANRLMKELPEEYRGQALALVRFLHDNHVKYKTTNAESSAK